MYKVIGDKVYKIYKGVIVYLKYNKKVAFN